MYVECLRIWNFKKFDFVEVPFTDGANVVVGDNDSGKSTLLEALHLALTGVYRGRAISGAISEDLFNKQAVLSYFESARSGGGDPAPSIYIEVVFQGDSSETSRFLGDNNRSKTPEAGVYLSIELDEEEFGKDFENYVREGDCVELPVEYYRCVRRTFSRDRVTQSRLNFRSSLIDSSGFFLRPGSKAYVSKTARDALPERERFALAQAHRQARLNFDSDARVVSANEEIGKKVSSLSGKEVSFAASKGTKDAWENSVETRLNGILLENAGAGSQSITGMEIALSGGRESSGVVLVEEPEAHLSHSAMSELLEALPSRARGRQLVVSTHSSFVANKLDLRKIICLTDMSATRPFESLDEDDVLFFSRLAGYDTLRIVFCRAAILVEGDSDELIVQRAYRDTHSGRLPIQDRIEVISVGTSFLRFLRLGEMLGRRVVAITDNDGNLEKIREKYRGYNVLCDHSAKTALSHPETVAVSYPGDLLSKGSIENYSYNTLEPELFEANHLDGINKILGKKFEHRDDALRHMKSNKTECALKFFNYEGRVAFPGYIQEAIKFACFDEGTPGHGE